MSLVVSKYQTQSVLSFAVIVANYGEPYGRTTESLMAEREHLGERAMAAVQVPCLHAKQAGAEVARTKDGIICLAAFFMKVITSLDDITDAIRESRSNESNFDVLCKYLQEALAVAEKQNNLSMQNNLKEVQDKYASEYLKARETRDSAWPEFEKFVTQFERSINGV
jgi:hypothetical protein